MTSRSCSAILSLTSLLVGVVLGVLASRGGPIVSAQVAPGIRPGSAAPSGRPLPTAVPEKKAAAYGLVNLTANAAYVYCAYLWPKSDGPTYKIGFSTMIAFAAGSIGCVWVMRFWLMALNKKLRRSENEHQASYAY